MIEIFTGIFTAMLLLCAMLTYLWFTRDDPRYREFPGTPSDPYPGWPLSDFPEPEPVERRDLFGWLNPSAERLATTTELRALAYAGDMETINSEVAAFRALLQLDEWTS